MTTAIAPATARPMASGDTWFGLLHVELEGGAQKNQNEKIKTQM
jgi:hypothetical protein